MSPLSKHLMLPLLLLVLGAPLFVRAGEATDQIRQTTEKILAIVQDPALKGSEKEDERQKQMKAAIDERFDWAAMARGAIGKHWRTLSDAQRAEFSNLFGELVEKTYLSQVEGYSGEKILYKAEKEDGKFGVVDVLIVTLRETNIPVSYRVLKKGAAWFVYDVSIEGVSLVNNYRSQIGSILDTSTYADLIAKIKTKIDVAKANASGNKADGKTKKNE